MNVSEKRLAALKILESSGISPSNYAPPLVRLLWRMGVDIRPPHFAQFFVNVFLMGVFFATLWGSLMWIALWSRQGFAPLNALISAIVAGALFGLLMSAYYSYSHRKHNLPKWSEIEEVNLNRDKAF